MAFEALNINIDNLTPLTTILPTLTANVGTDFWRKPLLPTLTANVGTDLRRESHQLDVSSAPAVCKCIPAKHFKRARVTLTANWTHLYDQGGLLFILPGWPDRKAWIKAGIEVVNGQPCVSVVGGRDDASDWSLYPLTDTKTATIEIEREAEHSGNGCSLWVYKVEGEKRIAIREMTWVFKKNELDGDVRVGTYAARPTSKAAEGELIEEPLTVAFTDFEIVH